MAENSRVLVTGGAGYVGSALVPKLLEQGHKVRVMDLYMYGEHVLDQVKDHPNLEQVKGDIRDSNLLQQTLMGCDSVIHLACISNDPSFELDPDLGKSINYDAFFDLVDFSKANGVRRFVFASSSSVYGIQDTPDVTEELPVRPLTDYSKYKAMCEEVLLQKKESGFFPLIVRPATVSGYAVRQRLDLVVNILTNHAINNRNITVFGGDQMRPNVHIDDITDFYVKSLEWSETAIDCKVYNVGHENHTVNDIAKIIRGVVGEDVGIKNTPTDDLRSYQISSRKIKDDLGFVATRSVEDAARDLQAAFDDGRLSNPMSDQRYYNIKTMQSLRLR